jgi:hypothetical protein
MEVSVASACDGGRNMQVRSIRHLDWTSGPQGRIKVYRLCLGGIASKPTTWCSVGYSHMVCPLMAEVTTHRHDALAVSGQQLRASNRTK